MKKNARGETLVAGVVILIARSLVRFSCYLISRDAWDPTALAVLGLEYSVRQRGGSQEARDAAGREFG